MTNPLRQSKNIFWVKAELSVEVDMKIKAAIFDMDGTLVDSLMFWEDFWAKLNEKYIKQENFTPATEIDKDIRSMIFADAILTIKNYYNISAPIEELWEYANNGVEQFYREVAVIKDGAIDMLEYLKSKNIKICLASATQRKFINVAIESCGIADYFDCVLSCCEIGVGKDRPDIYLLAKDKLGCKIEEACVFEDSYLALETARSAGFRTAGLYDKYNYEHERLRASSDIYMDKGETLADLIEFIE